MKRGSFLLPAGSSTSGKKSGKPLRTFKEMADEFGVKPNALSTLIGARGGPRPVMKAGTVIHQTWYEPAVIRQWWKSIHNEDGTLKKAGE